MFAGSKTAPAAMTATPDPATPPPASFESALQELETLVRTLENGATSLEDALAAFERGQRLLAHCQQTLDQAEQKVRVLENGRLKDFAAEEENA